MRLTTLVTATRLSERAFWETSLLGRSLALFPPPLLPELHIRFENTAEKLQGLSTVYNAAIDRTDPNKNLLFVHDDVFIHDVFLQHRIAEGLARFDVIGLAGSRNSDLNQPSWGLAFDGNLNPTGWQRPEHVVLSGAVGHQLETPPLGVFARMPPVPKVGLYGNAPASCHLLDGLFLAARADRLQGAYLPDGSGTRDTPRVTFDPQFPFHLYDLDFCRTARHHGLTLGTWPILVTHGSAGNFSTPEFRAAARRYLDKWTKIGSSVFGSRSENPDPSSPSSPSQGLAPSASPSASEAPP